MPQLTYIVTLFCLMTIMTTRLLALTTTFAFATDNVTTTSLIAQSENTETMHIFIAAALLFAQPKVLLPFMDSVRLSTKHPLQFHVFVPDDERKDVVHNVESFPYNISVYTHAQVHELTAYHAFREISGCEFPQPCVEWHAKLLLHRLLPDRVKHVLCLDMDIRIRKYRDLHNLYALLHEFNDDQVIGLAPELNLLYPYKWKQYVDRFKAGQFQGFNGGVQLQHLQHMRNIDWEHVLLKTIEDSRLRDAVVDRSFPETYQANRHPMRHCDQDIYTFTYLLEQQHYHILSCGWNRQYCRASLWNRTELDAFARCEHVYIDHFNCRYAMLDHCANKRVPERDCIPYLLYKAPI